MEYDWDGLARFRLTGQNRVFIRYYLSRITSYTDIQLAGRDRPFRSYFSPSAGKSYQIEHIWANKIEYQRDEVNSKEEFDQWRDSIGALLLLPSGINQSFSSAKYKDKLPHYLKENSYAASLYDAFYEKNPTFTKNPT